MSNTILKNVESHLMGEFGTPNPETTVRLCLTLPKESSGIPKIEFDVKVKLG